jgi:hypothetical protein
LQNQFEAGLYLIHEDISKRNFVTMSLYEDVQNGKGKGKAIQEEEGRDRTQG